MSILMSLILAAAGLAGSTPEAPAMRSTPIAGITTHDLRDSFAENHGTGPHEAIDIMEPRGTPVHAVVDGMIAKLFLSKPVGNTIYLFDNDQVYCYYYAHLDGYVSSLHEGVRVKSGDVIAYVGSTGNASPLAPHLHFAIFELGPERHWWQGSPINPYPFLVRMVSH